MVNKYVKAAAMYVAADAARSAYRAGKGYVKRKYAQYRKRGSRSVRAGRGAGTITSQRDSAVTYGGRRGSGRGNRKFLMRVRRALIDEQPASLYTSMFKSSDTAAGGTQNFLTVYLGDVDTSNQGDIWNVFKDAYTAAAVADVEQERLYIRNMSMDVQLKNTGTERLIVDMYICVARVNHDSIATMNADLSGWFGDMVPVGGVNFTNPGFTLFNIPGFSRKWKITKKQSFVIKEDEIIQTTVIGRRNVMIQGRHLQDYRCSLKGITQCVLFQVRGVPENTASTSGLTGWSAAWSAQTRITYAKAPGNVSETVGQSK